MGLLARGVGFSRGLVRPKFDQFVSLSGIAQHWKVEVAGSSIVEPNSWKLKFKKLVRLILWQNVVVFCFPKGMIMSTPNFGCI